MRKIHKDYENPIDDVLLDAADEVQPMFHKLGFTPNIITTLSLLSVIFASSLLFQGHYFLGAFFIFLGYFFDCLDGHFARTYNMVSPFGDYYDHISDICKAILLMVTFFMLDRKKFFIVLPFVIIVFILMTVHLGCQEIYYTKNNSTNGDSLAIIKKLCPSNYEKINGTISYTRHFGCGTANVFLALVAVYYGC